MAPFRKRGRRTTAGLSAQGHPRPQLVRPGWQTLDGAWDFALDPEGAWSDLSEVRFDRTIQVPFAPETPASGIGETGFFAACWYRRRFEAPALRPDQRFHLHFGAVDYRATVWIDGALVATHEGGYTPFRIALDPSFLTPGPHELVVRAEDDPHDLAKPRGKQDWQREPHGIWYPRTSGIWQTVWSEVVSARHVESLRWTPNLERWEIELCARVAGPIGDALRLEYRLWIGNLLIAEDSCLLLGADLSRRIALTDPGIDDYRNEFLWSPDSPILVDAELRLRDEQDAIVDAVDSYTALRTVAVQGESVVLNGRPLELRMVLDQGYWPETGMTPPDDEALRRDVALAKAMGFNGVRKHQKIEDPRYLHWADRLGLVVWAEMPSCYRFTREAVERLTTQWLEVLHRDVSHPCIVAWVPFNESWGVPNLPEIPAERHFVQAVYHLTKTVDPTRPVIGNDGWESVATDVIGIHDYEDDPRQLGRRYESYDRIPELFQRERPAGRLLALDGHRTTGLPLFLSEFGGIAFGGSEETTWGYSRAADAEEFARLYEELLDAVRGTSTFAGFCYTQFADTYQEVNGLLDAQRRPKIPLERIRAATRGARRPRALAIEREWRERIMRFHLDHELLPPDLRVEDD